MEKKPGSKRKYTAPRKKNGKLDVGNKDIEIDYNRVRDLSKFMYVDRELAVCLGMAFSTFNRKKGEDPKLRDAIAEGKAHGAASLRSKQMEMAMKGNVPLLKWLGAQYLKQAEKLSHANDPENPLPQAKQATYNFNTADEAWSAFQQKIRQAKED